MTREFNRLTDTELADELTALEDKLAAHPEESRLRNLVHNLRVHQIELEMQNRELRDAHRALEEARARYADLYDFAPIGYMTLDAAGVIQEINLTGARMLGQPRIELTGKPFAPYLVPGRSKELFRHLRQAFDDDAKVAVELPVQSERGRTLWLSLESVRAPGKDGMLCRTAMVDVTRRRQADQSRRESEARLSLIADNVPVLISYVDTDRRYVFNNAAYERWFGHSRDYIRGRRMRDILGDDAYGALRNHVDAALSGEEVHFEAEVPYRDAGTRYISASYIPHKDHAGAVAGFFVLIHDLTERRRMEQALTEEREFISAVLDTAGALVLILDRHGRIVRFNRECERVSGYHASEVVGRRFDMLLLPEERAGVEDVFNRLSSGDFPNTYENYWAAKDGSRRLIAWANTALTDGDGSVTHVVGTGIDVSDRHRMEEDLRHREQQLRVVTDAVPMLIAYVDRKMRYRFANAAYHVWFGLEPEEMVGRRVEELMGRETFSVMRPYAERALAGEEVFYENTVRHRIRGRRDVSANLVPDCDVNGNVDGYFSVMVDITDRKRSEESDKLRLLEAAHADRLVTMGEMTTEIAHELNQPLTAIATSADVLVKQAKQLSGDDSGKLAETLVEISKQAHRAAQVVKHVRTFARRREPELAAIHLDQIIKNAMSLVHAEVRSSGVDVETVLPGRVIVEADAVLIEQLIVNLARNAIDAMTAGGVESPRLSVTVTEVGGKVETKVADNGPGLSVEARQHLFEPFYTTKKDGMGLGLAICRSIVKAHSGRMWADNPPDGGAEFGFTLAAATETKNE